MALNIDSVQDKGLKTALKFADSLSESNRNNILDSNEVSVFIKQAYRHRCSAAEIMEIVSQVEISAEENDKIQETIDKLNKLESLKAEFKKQKEIYKNIPKKGEKLKNNLKYGLGLGAIGGVYTGLSIYKDAVDLFAAKPMRDALIWGTAMFAIATAVGMGLSSLLFGTKEQNEYENSTIKPLQDEIKILENEFLTF